MSKESMEGHYAQGDIVRAVDMILRYSLSLDSAGATECERQLREFGEGNRTLWSHEEYLRQTVFMAQAIVLRVREASRPKMERPRSSRRN